MNIKEQLKAIELFKDLETAKVYCRNFLTQSQLLSNECNRLNKYIQELEYQLIEKEEQ